MLSRIGAKWHWYDWIFIAFVVIAISALIVNVAPTSGLAHALHQGFHFLALIVGWVGSGLLTLAQLLNQL